MSPLVRGRAIAQIESSGRAKKTFDILLWLRRISQEDLRTLDSLQQLRDYLGAIPVKAATVNLWLPIDFVETHPVLDAFGIPVNTLPITIQNADVNATFGDKAPPEMGEAAGTALSCDADLLFVGDSLWYPFYQEFEKLGVLIGSSQVVLRQAEIFAKGNDIPWSFDHPTWDVPWASFYFLAENDTLVIAQRFLNHCQTKGVSKEVREIGRTLVFNRIPNILFTRDRLLFFEMQQAAARRAKWARQKFQFEVGYHLNFYYILLHGAFDHLAVLLNGVLGLGLGVRDVYAAGKPFLKALENKAPELHALFTAQDTSDFMERVAALRHASAHRSQIMPGPIYEEPDRELTPAELDAEIRLKGLDEPLRFFPPGPLREAFLEQIRFKLKISKLRVLIEDAVYIETKKMQGFINPLLDTEWNFSKFHIFLSRVLDAAAKRI